MSRARASPQGTGWGSATHTWCPPFPSSGNRPLGPLEVREAETEPRGTRAAWRVPFPLRVPSAVPLPGARPTLPGSCRTVGPGELATPQSPFPPVLAAVSLTSTLIWSEQRWVEQSLAWATGSETSDLDFSRKLPSSTLDRRASSPRPLPYPRPEPRAGSQPSPDLGSQVRLAMAKSSSRTAGTRPPRPEPRGQRPAASWAACQLWSQSVLPLRPCHMKPTTRASVFTTSLRGSPLAPQAQPHLS